MMNVLCLCIWIYWLIDGIYAVSAGKPLSPVAYFCAVAICIIDYLSRIFNG